MGYLLLSDYGLVGNQSSAALISRLGSVDWLCLPWLDSPSHFAALQDEDQGGRFQIMPQGEFRSHQRYLQRTQILETTFETPHGSAVLRDWMPVTEVFAAEPVLCRELEMLHGQIPWLLTCVPRFAGGGTPATAEKIDRGVLFRGSVLGDLARLETDLSLDIPPSGGAALARFDLTGGESAHFCWSWGRREALTKFPLWRDCATAWHTWAHRCPPEGCLLSGPWHDLAARSGLVLKILSNRYAGSLSEAVITPRPSTRSAWIRDCALATLGLHRLGHEAEAGSSFGWLMQLLERDGAEGLQTTYTLDGGKFADGGAGFQLETYGQILLACERILGAQSQLPPGLWVQLASILDHVCQVWRRPDFAPWLLQSKAEHFVASKFFCWVALDRGIKIAHRLREPVPRRWSTELGILRKTILEQGFDRAQGTFVRSFGDRGVDPRNLQIPLLGFLPHDDPRVKGTLEKTIRTLGKGPLLRRSQSEHLGDLWSTLILIHALAQSGQVEEASDRLADLSTLSAPLGLLGETVDPDTGHLSGNFPSAAVHLALIEAVWSVGTARARPLYQAAG